MAAAVDISTIATYAVGWLPLSVLKNTKIGDQKILAVNSLLDLNQFDVTNAGGKDFQIWNTVKHPWIVGADQVLTISPCKVAHSYVIWREYGDTKYSNSAKLKTISGAYEGLEICVLYGNQLVAWPEWAFFSGLHTALNQQTGYTTSSPWEYKKAMDALTNTTWWRNLPLVKNTLVYLGSWSAVFATGNTIFGWAETLSIATLIQKSKWFVWPLVTIYSSLLNFAQLTDTNITSTAWTSGVFIIKSLVAIALFFPLIALALVLIARIWVLRLYIVASPFIILKASFKDFVKIKWLDDYLSINGVAWIIFAPVITVAALSISLIFMTALVNGFTGSDTTAAIHETLGIQKIPSTEVNPWNDGIVFESIASLEYSKLPWWEAMDRFSWLMVNFFAVGLMRMIFFAALKASKLGESIGWWVEKFGKNVFQTLPILPIWKDGTWVGISSATKVLWWVPDRWIADRTRAQEKIVSDYVYGNEKTPPTTIDSTLASTLITATSDKASIIKWLTDAWVKEADVGTVISGSTDNIAATIAGLTTLKEEDRLKLAGVVSEASWGKLTGTEWYTTATAKIAATAAKPSVDTFVWKQTFKTTTDLEGLFTNATWTDKTNIEAYFKAAWTKGTYIQTIGDKTYTVTQTIDTKDTNKFTYAATETPKAK